MKIIKKLGSRVIDRITCSAENTAAICQTDSLALASLYTTLQFSVCDDKKKNMITRVEFPQKDVWTFKRAQSMVTALQQWPDT